MGIKNQIKPIAYANYVLFLGKCKHLLNREDSPTSVVPDPPNNTTSSSVTAKASTVIADLEGYGYTWYPGNSATQNYLRFDSISPPYLVDVLGYDTTGNTLTIYQAWNALDPNPYKVKMTDILISYWVYKSGQGKAVGDLEIVEWNDVTNDGLVSYLIYVQQNISPESTMK